MSASDLARACAAAPFSRELLCKAVDDYARPVMGQTLCTVNRFDEPTMRLTRVYSSNPAAYPVGGSKEKRGTEWGRAAAAPGFRGGGR